MIWVTMRTGEVRRLTRAKMITDWRRKGKLAELSRLLRKFNPQRKEWVR